MKKLTLMFVVTLSALAFTSQASAAPSAGCPLLRKGQTLHQDGTAVPLASRSTPASSPRSSSGDVLTGR